MAITGRTKETPADPQLLHRNDSITGRQRPTRKRQRPAEMPDALAVMEIRQQARAQFPTNDTIKAVRASARLSAQDRVHMARGGRSQAPALKSLARRWGAFLIQTARPLTTAQARSLRQRSTTDELLSLDEQQRALIGFHL